MSRIGKKPIAVPDGVKVTFPGSKVSIEGPKGKLDFEIPQNFNVELKDKSITVSRPTDEKQAKATHGLIRSLINNMIIGVVNGYMRQLEIVGVGFKAQSQANVLNIQLSYTHPIDYKIPSGITIETPKPTMIIIKGIDKALVGKVAADIRDFYRPEPYKGKGIRYSSEYVRRKAGKTVAGAGAGAS